MLRRALLDPHVTKHRITGRLAGYRIDADELLQSVREGAGDPGITRETLDAAVRHAGGQRLRTGPVKLLRVVMDGPHALRPTYWLSMVSYRQAVTDPNVPPRGE